MEKIAIIGLSCLVPGAKTPEEFWENLINQKKVITEADETQMGVDADLFFSLEKGKEDRFYCKRGGYIRDFQFDANGYDLPTDFLTSLDDTCQWSLHVSREALKDSGYLNNSKALSDCGIILGNLSFPTKSSNHLVLPIYQEVLEGAIQKLIDDEAFELAKTKTDRDIALQNILGSGYSAAIVSQSLGLKGLSYSLDAACATSLYSVKLACDQLLTGQANMMLAGAVSAGDPFFINIGFSIFQASPESHEKSCPFDKDTHGLTAGEGAGVFVLKRYSDAVKDGDNIRAVINGAGWSNDGRGQFVLSPNTKGQILAFERTYQSGSVDPKSIDYMECHATGTPLGDKVELRSIDTYFGKHDAKPLVGSVKSNLGHLLTTAGMAGMIKIILAMEKGVIPGTSGLESPISSPADVISKESIIQQTTDWPQQGEQKRAAVSAFGFGGTNAHLVLEEHLPKQKIKKEKRKKVDSPAMSIIGMDALFGEAVGLSEFNNGMYEGKQYFNELPKERWKGIESEGELLKKFGLKDGKAPKGAYIKNFDFDYMHFKIPPNPNDPLIPQQLLVMKVVDNALRETNIKEGENIAVLVAMGTEITIHQHRGRVDLNWQIPQGKHKLETEKLTKLEKITKDSFHNFAQINQYTSFIGNLMATRISSLWDFSGPAFTVSSEENSVFKTLQIANTMLATRDVDAVVIGAVDFSGSMENVLLRNQQDPVNTGTPCFGMNSETDGWLIGEGAGAIVLKRKDDAEREKLPVYANIDTIRIETGSDQTTVANSAKNALQQANLKPSDIGYLELYGSGTEQETAAELNGLTTIYQKDTKPLTLPVGSVKSNIGHTYAASGMASLIRTALALQHRYIPNTPNWSSPKDQKTFEKSPFFIPTKSRFWYRKEDKPRIAAISGLGQDGCSAHLILSEVKADAKPDTSYLSEPAPWLFPLVADDQRHLHVELRFLEDEMEEGIDLRSISRDCFEKAAAKKEANFALALIAGTEKELRQEIQEARNSLQSTFSRGAEWSSPSGSFFTSRPQGKQGKVAFVYPGGFNSYPGLCRDLFQLIPELETKARKVTSHLDKVMGCPSMHPNRLERPTPEMKQKEHEKLLHTPLTMFESGLTASMLYTKILRDYLKIEPDSVFGYSMGEVSMVLSMGLWENADEMMDKLNTINTFRDRLAGPMNTVREAWNPPKDQEEIWACYTVMEPAESVRQALENSERIFIMFINHQHELVIGGDPGYCEQFLKKHKLKYFKAPAGDVTHCEIVRSEYQGLVDIHTSRVTPLTTVDFYSAAEYDKTNLTTDVAADNIAKIYCKTIDFPKLTNKLYEDGARVFIEAGARSGCSGWIDEILKGEDHLAIGIDRKGVSERNAILQMVAKLFSHRVSMDLSILCPGEEHQAQKKKMILPVVVGGKRIQESMLTEKNRNLFKSGTPEKAETLQEKREVNPTKTAETKTEATKQKPVVPPETKTEQKVTPQDTAQKQRTQRIQPAATGATTEQRKTTTITEEKPQLIDQYIESMKQHDQSYENFLNDRKNAMKQMADMILTQMDVIEGRPTTASYVATPYGAPQTEVGQTAQTLQPQPTVNYQETTVQQQFGETPAVTAQQPAVTKSKRTDAIWNEEDLLEFAQGDIANVFGNEYAIIDTYKPRVRLPMPPYLLVSRVTKMNAKTLEFKPSTMTTEYDIPHNSWYSTDGRIPWCVAVESGQCDLLLISYLGIDFQNKGERAYRLLDCTLTYMGDLPKEGETLRYDISINNFAKSGDSLLFFFTYECYVGDRHFLKMTGGCAGFFTREELDAGKGVIRTKQQLEERKNAKIRDFKAPLPCDKQHFTLQELQAMTRGDFSSFSSAHHLQNRSQGVVLEGGKMLMVDEILSVQPKAGAWGLGVVEAKLSLTPDAWYFPCHFKDDEVMAGSLMAEACVQLLQFYMLYLGIHTIPADSHFQPYPKLPQKVVCRGEVSPVDTMLTYRLEVRDLGLGENPYAIADIEIYSNGKFVVLFENLGVLLKER